MLRVEVDTSAAEAALRRLGDGLDRLDMTSVARRGAREIATRAPRRTGQLSRSARAERVGRQGARIRVVAVYGGVINYGWPRRNISPSGFVEAGTAAALAAAPALASKQVQSLINQEGLRR